MPHPQSYIEPMPSNQLFSHIPLNSGLGSEDLILFQLGSHYVAQTHRCNDLTDLAFQSESQLLHSAPEFTRLHFFQV